MLVYETYWRLAKYAIFWYLCLLGSNLNVHTKPQKLRPPRYTFGINTICQLIILYYIFITCKYMHM